LTALVFIGVLMLLEIVKFPISRGGVVEDGSGAGVCAAGVGADPPGLPACRVCMGAETAPGLAIAALILQFTG